MVSTTLTTTLRDAIAHNTRDRILDRMKKEPNEERVGHDLGPRVPHRYVGLADSDNLIFSRMPPLAPAEEEDTIMAEPVGILNDDDI